MTILGLHHITLVCSNAQQTVDFYSGVLGLRLVKQTVNFDDPGSYHLYFGDGFGSAGLGGPGYVAGGEMFRLKSRSDDGESFDAIRVFDAVVAYWTRFMDDHGIK